MHVVAKEVFRLLLGNKAKVSLVKGPLSRMYLAVVVTPTEMSKGQSDNTNNATKKLD